MDLYKCPVCGYDELLDPPQDYNICPCCFTEFGYNDVEWGIDTLRKEWIESGAKWLATGISKPLNYDAIKQLLNVDYHVTYEDKVAIAKHSNSNIDVIEIAFPEPRRVQISLSFSKANNTIKAVSTNIPVLQPV